MDRFDLARWVVDESKRSRTPAVRQKRLRDESPPQHPPPCPSSELTAISTDEGSCDTRGICDSCMDNFVASHASSQTNCEQFPSESTSQQSRSETPEKRIRSCIGPIYQSALDPHATPFLPPISTVLTPGTTLPELIAPLGIASASIDNATDTISVTLRADSSEAVRDSVRDLSEPRSEPYSEPELGPLTTPLMKQGWA